MKTYERVWRVVWGMLLAPAFLVAPAVMPMGTLAPLIVVSAAIGAATVIASPAGFSWSSRGMRAAAWRALLASVGCVAFAAAIEVLGPVAFPCLALGGVTSPPLVRWIRRHARGSSPILLADDELCREWRFSSGIVRGAPAHARLGIVLRRQAYLDELERRNSAGLRAWLEADAWNDESLERFVVRKPTIDG